MAAKRDYYEILGVQKSADADMIKKAYRKLAKSIIRIPMQVTPSQSKSLKK